MSYSLRLLRVHSSFVEAQAFGAAKKRGIVRGKNMLELGPTRVKLDGFAKKTSPYVSNAAWTRWQRFPSCVWRAVTKKGAGKNLRRPFDIYCGYAWVRQG
ncbi:hypothetical protein [Paraburkholderia sp. RAU2J]|uniref:hypothetical protein n=1 Tax=Paraburkholderia sp. RAU2J TaxID=1938810 RepID=UPI001315545A|nr:hypothetical protein [Paraburkholderia sp. RAU2J]